MFNLYIMDENLFTNKDLYSQHFDIKYREKRLEDFKIIYNILKDHLEPEKKAKINEEKIKEYVNMYKEENRDFIKRVLHVIMHIQYDKFVKDSIEQTELFNKKIGNKKYVYIIGTNDNQGTSTINFNIYKSNLWMFMLIYNTLKNKPYDILLNLKIAIKLYGDKYDYLIVDDCIYSGTQMIDQGLYASASESLYKYSDSFINKSTLNKTLFKPVQNHNINVHILVPYISYNGSIKLFNLENTTCLKIFRYNKYIVNPFSALLNADDLEKLYNLYNNFYETNTYSLIPIFFDHAIADSISTIELILIKGQVLDDKNKRLIFIDECDIYSTEEENYIGKKYNCPIPPYKYYENILKEKL